MKVKLLKTDTQKYSTENEIDTGKTWFEGQKIFRKCFQGLIKGSPGMSYNLFENTGIEKPVLIEGIIKRNDSPVHTCINSYENADSFSYMYMSGGNIKHLWKGNDFLGKQINIVVEYIK